MRLVLIFFLAISFHLLFGQVQAGNSSYKINSSLVEEVRPFFLKIFGEKWTIKLIGNSPVPNPELKNNKSIIFPPLPKIVYDAKSVAVFEKKKDKIVLKSDLEAKFYYIFIKEIYEVTKQLKPSEGEVSIKMNILSQGGTREGIYHSLVLDSNYGKMENDEKLLKPNAADFAVYFYERYIGKKISKENLRGMNIYTVKRLMADKALDIIDAYGDNREDLEKWYAVLSSDLASKFPLAWTSKLRKETSSVIHKSWASRVPVEHIKSESLIKIHTAMNSMM